MKIELKELSINDSKDVYEMILEIGLGENGFTNSFPTNSFEEFTNSLAEDNQRSRRVIEGNKGQLTEIKNGVCKYWIRI